MTLRPSVSIVGSGPASLMAADVLSSRGYSVSIFEKRKSSGRKLLIAGSSGLNITNELPVPEFITHYTGPRELWKKTLSAFSPQDWIRFIENLGIGTFKGTSGRYFVEDMKASKFLKAWTQRLASQGVQFVFDSECTGFSVRPESQQIELRFHPDRKVLSDIVLFGLGGGSYEPQEKPLRWPKIFLEHGLAWEDFKPSNVGYQVPWSESFLKEAEGQPIKNASLTSSRGIRKGDMVVTRYGLEGTPVYFVGEGGQVHIDLKPDLTLDQILAKCRSVKENLSPIRRIKRQLNLCPASLALLFHMTDAKTREDLKLLAQTIKKFPITFLKPQSLDESISSRGGLGLSELNESFMLKKFPGVFAAGEMLNWDAPTGGFLLQACVSQGYCAGIGMLEYLRKPCAL